MSNKKTARTGNVKRKTWRSRYCWLIIGMVLLCCAIAIFALIYALNSFGLMGVSFSEKNGFYSSDLYISIKPEGFLLVNEPVIKYNLDGDDLFDSGEWFDGTIKLEVPENGYQLYTITAFACTNDDSCTDPQTATYVLGKNLSEDVTIDIVNVNSSKKSLYDYGTGIMVGGRTYDENFVESSGGYVAGNYNNRGKKWMRKAFITRFDVDGEVIWDQDAYIGISGFTSSSNSIKSLKVTMSSEDGTEGKTVRLRSGNQDQFSGNIRSSIVDRLAEESKYSGSAGTRRMAVFLNGQYYGIFDLQDTFSEQNLAKKFNLEKANKIEKHSGTEKSVFNVFGITSDVWENLNLNVNRSRLEELIDMDDYLDYYTFFILVNNTDWPMNNFEAWRYRDDSVGNKYADGRLRFLIRDTDLIYYTEGNINWFDGAVGDIFADLMENKHNGNGSSFSKVMASEYYRQKFINMVKELLEGPFKTENVLKIIDEEAEKIEHQVKLFSTEEEYEDWVGQIELMKKAASERENKVKADIQKYFGVKI